MKRPARHYRHKPNKPAAEPIPSKVLAGMIGYPATLAWMLFTNAGAFAHLTSWLALLFFGWLISAFVYLLIAGFRGELRPQSLREDWHDIVGKPKDH